ncbi:methyltransferase domain-containing protein [Aerococcaceae bacterium NML180378]|nr:methyltransferase domain-containing protein [Aerococcaceae bacterium NML180378]
MSFTQIAQVYDRFNDLEVYEHWLDFTMNACNEQPHKVLDVACGTGWFTQLLAPFCEEVVAFDIDAAMLEVACNEQGASENIRYLQADMLNLSAFDTDFDLATCYADSLCFLQNEAQLQQAFVQIANRLREGGTFLFDVWTPYQVTRGFDGFNYFDSDDEYALLWDSEVDGWQATHYLTVFRKQASGLYERIDTTLIERTYPLATYLEALCQASFKQIEVFVDYGATHYDEQVHETADRWFFRCVK